MRIFAALCLCSLLFVSRAWGLAAVESRTGEPVVRESQRMSPHSAPRVVQEDGHQVEEILPSQDHREFQGTGVSASESSSERTSYRQSQTPSQRSSQRPSQRQTQSRSSVFQGKPLHSQPAQSYSQGSTTQYSEHHQSPISRTQAEEQRALRQTLTQMEALQKELHDLRGAMEEQEHELKQLRKSQQDLYQDLERKVKTANSYGTSSGEGTAYSATATSAAVSTAGSTVGSVKPEINAGTKAAAAAALSGKKALKSDVQTAEKKANKTDPLISSKAKESSKEKLAKKGEKTETTNEAKTANTNSKILRTPPAGSPSKGPGLITRETAEDLGVISKTTPTSSQVLTSTPTPSATAPSAPSIPPAPTIASKLTKATSIDDSKPMMTIKAEDPSKDSARKSQEKKVSQHLQPWMLLWKWNLQHQNAFRNQRG